MVCVIKKDIMIQKDEKQNIWHGYYTTSQIRDIQNSIKFIWYQGIDGCNWKTPHYGHRMKVDVFLFKNIDHDCIFILPQKHNSNCWICLILGFIIGLLISYNLFFEKCPSVIKEKIIHDTIFKHDTIHVQIPWDTEDISTIINGKKAEFKIAVLTQEYRWALGKEDYLENGKSFDELGQLVDNFPSFKNAIGLIAVGVASQENFENRKREENRAEVRADNIINMLKMKNYLQSKNLYVLNLGQFTSYFTDSETSYQRRIIIIGIMQQDKSMSFEEIEQSVKQAIIKSNGLAFDKDKYSKFEFYSSNIVSQ